MECSRSISSIFNNPICGDKMMVEPAWHKIVKKKNQSSLDEHIQEEEDDS